LRGSAGVHEKGVAGGLINVIEGDEVVVWQGTTGPVEEKRALDAVEGVVAVEDEEDVPSKGVEIGRRRCNLSVAKP
jgi:hypothetical protein